MTGDIRMTRYLLNTSTSSGNIHDSSHMIPRYVFYP